MVDQSKISVGQKALDGDGDILAARSKVARLAQIESALGLEAGTFMGEASGCGISPRDALTASADEWLTLYLRLDEEARRRCIAFAKSLAS